MCSDWLTCLVIYVIYRWTGSNTNPNNNDGQGRAGTDRSNLVLQMDADKNTASGVRGEWGRNYPASVVNASFLDLSEEDLLNLAFLSPGKVRYLLQCTTVHSFQNY